MVDFGLIGLFAIQCGMVALCYVAYTRISSKVLELKGMERKIEDVPALIAPIAAKLATVENRMVQVEQTPAASKKRFEEVEANLADFTRLGAKLEKSLATTNARISTLNRWKKRDLDSDEETDPAPQGEREDGSMPIAPPGSHPQSTPPAPSMQAGFGVLKRRVGNG